VEGWIKDYRQELESAVWQKPPLYHRVWQWLKYQANHEDRKLPNGKVVARGQRLTSYRQIAEGVSYYDERGIQRIPNPKTIKTILEWLEREGNITLDHGNREYTVITLCNYSLFQGDELDESNGKVTRKKQRLDTNKNDKNEKNEKKKQKDIKMGYAEFVTLTPAEYQKLVDRFGEQDAKDRIERLNLYKGSKGIKYDSDYMTILNWARKDEKEKGGPAGGTHSGAARGNTPKIPVGRSLYNNDD
jgi:hypothetical protein